MEVPHTNVQQQPRPTPQQLANQPKPGQPRQVPTAQQLAQATPEQRKAYQQALARSQQLSMMRSNPADLQKCAIVFHNEMLKTELPLIQMTPEIKHATATKLTIVGKSFKKVKQALPKWYAITGDETRLRQFCQMVSSLPAYSPYIKLMKP
jgi:hypothetical protein